MMIGRAAEQDFLRGMLADARRGTSRAVVVRGEPGIGKTALLDAMQQEAESFHVLRMAAVQAESGFAFAGLHELLSPILGHLDAIPDVQAAALRGALALSESTGVGRLSIGAAVLSLLSSAAAERPLLVLVDDAEWLDQASSDALTFAARRLQHEGVALALAAGGAPGHSLPAQGIPDLVVRGLSNDDATALVRERFGTELADDVVRAVVAASGGRPRVVLEAPLLLSAEQRRGRAPLPHPIPVGDSLTHAMLQRMQSLSDPARDAALLAAAAGTQTMRVIVTAEPAVGQGLAEVEEAGLVEIAQGRFTFAGAMTASSVYYAATPLQRREAHRRLAESLAGDEQYRERRAWHLAAAAVEPDDVLAGELACVAEASRARRGNAAAAALFETAASLAMSTSLRAQLTADAAWCAWLAGQVPRTRTLLQRLPEGFDDARLAADVTLLRAQVAAADGDSNQFVVDLMTGADAIVGDDPSRALRMWVQASWTPRPADSQEAARRAVQAAGSGVVVDQLLAALALSRAASHVGDQVTSAKMLSRAASLSSAADLLSQLDASAVSTAVSLLGDHPTGVGEQLRSLLHSLTEAARQYAIVALPGALTLRAHCDVRAGNWSDASVGFFEAATLAEEIGLGQIGVRARSEAQALAALQGQSFDVSSSLPGLVRQAQLGALALSQGDAHVALPHLRSALDSDAAIPWWLTEFVGRWDLIEATVRSEGREVGESVVRAHSAALVDPREQQWVIGLVADDHVYADHFVAACAGFQAANDRRPYAEARVRQAWGERLRRAGHPIRAREQLRQAHELFEQLGAQGWVEAARRELKASGETARRRQPAGLGELTPQELQVATVIAEGLTYKEVAARLFLSPKTIEFHLSKVYRKLGIASRRDLAARLAGAGGVPGVGQ